MPFHLPDHISRSCRAQLGILSRSQPRLATTLRKVPNGTNGGISAWGTLCSLVGGLIVGVLAMITLRLNEPSCRWQLSLLALGGTAGLLGSAVRSLARGVYVPLTRSID